MFLLMVCFLVLTVADIMSDLHSKQEPLHGPVSAQGRDVPKNLKVRLHSHLNTLAITAPKDAFLKSTLLGVPHIRFDFTDDKQKNIRKPVEKKPSKSLLFDKTQDSGRAEPIIHPENFKDPIRNSDLQKPVPTDVNTISLASSFHESSFLTSTPTSFVTPEMDTQQIKIMDQSISATPYRRNIEGYQSTLGTDKLFQRASVTLAAENVPEYIKNNLHWTSTTPATTTTLSTNDLLQSRTFITEDPYATTTESFASPTTSYPAFMASKHESTTPHLESTAPSSCRELCEQRPDHQEHPTLDPIERTSSSMAVLTTASNLMSGLLLKAPTGVQPFTGITDDHQVKERINQSDPKQTFNPPAWQDLPRFPTRKRPVCPYPPFPNHGTFYFRSIKNPGPLQYKHYIQYACYPGYTLTNGDVYSYCQHNGQWSGQTPLCLGKM